MVFLVSPILLHSSVDADSTIQVFMLVWRPLSGVTCGGMLATSDAYSKFGRCCPSRKSVHVCPTFRHNFLTDLKTNSARLTNDLIAGTIGGFVGTALNTPYVTERLHIT